MPSILHKAGSPNWTNGPLTEGGALSGREDGDACRLGIKAILLHVPQASLKLQNPVFILC